MSGALLAALPRGPVSAWPDDGDWGGDDGFEDWIVGVAIPVLGGAPFAVEVGAEPPANYWEIAEVGGRGLALALAAHLNALPAMHAALRLADAAFARLLAAGTVVDDGTADAVRAVRAALDAAEGRA